MMVQLWNGPGMMKLLNEPIPKHVLSIFGAILNLVQKSPKIEGHLFWDRFNGLKKR